MVAFAFRNRVDAAVPVASWARCRAKPGKDVGLAWLVFTDHHILHSREKRHMRNLSGVILLLAAAWLGYQGFDGFSGDIKGLELAKSIGMDTRPMAEEVMAKRMLLLAMAGICLISGFVLANSKNE